MKKFIQILCVTLTLVSFWGCGAPVATEPVATQPTAPLQAAVATQEELLASLEVSPRAVLTADITLTQTIGVKERILDGGGFTLTGPELQQEEVVDENGKAEMQNVPGTENAVMICSGTVENLKVKGAYRCLGDCKEYPMNGDVHIKNVDAEGTLYALSIGRGNGEGFLRVEECTLRGWVNINKIKGAQFQNCTFGYDSNGKNGYFRTYKDATLIGCNFENWVDENGKVTRYNIHFNKSTKGVTLTLEDCYAGDTLITQDNLKTLLKVTNTTNTIIVRNTTN